MTSLRKSVFALLICVVCLFSGCFAGGDVKTLLSPPQLGDQQLKIKQALKKSVGGKFQLKFPKTGDYRSAYVIANIDDEPTDEAIAFYVNSGDEYNNSKIRINILDQKDGEWVSTFDHAGEGTDIDKIIISHISSTTHPDIIIGYQLLSDKDKIVKGYNYSDGVLTTTYVDTYSLIEEVNLDNEQTKQLLVISPKDSEGNSSAKLVKNIGDRLMVTSSTPVSEQGTDYVNVCKGYVDRDIPAIFIDSDRGDKTIQTQILYSADGKLRNPLASTDMLIAKTVRPSKYLSVDVDKDGIIDIPLVIPMTGYETVPDSEKLYLTNFMVYSQFSLRLKNTGYYNVDKGYCFMIPNRWLGYVTVKEDPETDETVFYKYNNDIAGSTEELMRICVVNDGLLSDKVKDGYKNIITSNQKNYMVKIPYDETAPLVLTLSEIIFNFTIV